MISKTEWAYIAGVIDSDGCIQATHSSGKYCHGRAELHIIQRDMPIIEFFYSRFGGSVNMITRHTPKGDKYYLRWMITGIRMVEIIEGCLPYLVLKKAQGELAIQLQSIVLPKGNAKKLPVELLEKRESIANRMKLLNSPATTECASDFIGIELRNDKLMRQSELTQMINRQSESRSTLTAQEKSKI